MTETPTPDEIARWAAEHHGWTPEDYPDSGEFCVECGEHMPCPTTRLLALVAAQAEQNAELRAALGRMAQDAATQIQGTADDLTRAAEQAMLRFRDDMMQRVVEPLIAERDAARAELSALRATDEYQRWARAVTERDAAREAVAALRARVEAEIESWHHTVVEDCWYTCPAATEEREGGTCCDADRRGAACDCGLDFRKAKIRAALDGGAAT